MTTAGFTTWDLIAPDILETSMGKIHVPQIPLHRPLNSNIVEFLNNYLRRTQQNKFNNGSFDFDRTYSGYIRISKFVNSNKRSSTEAVTAQDGSCDTAEGPLVPREIGVYDED